MSTRKDGLNPDDWHDTLTAMRPAYDALARIFPVDLATTIGFDRT